MVSLISKNSSLTGIGGRLLVIVALIFLMFDYTNAQKKQAKPLATAKTQVVKVAVVIQDPKIAAQGNKRMHEIFKTPGYKFQWHDPYS